MRISQNGLDLIKHFEGMEPKAYRCPAGVLTIGYGSTGKHVKPGMTITEAEAEALLRKDVGRFEDAVGKLVRVKLDQDEFDALVSFAFNLGAGNLAESTLLKKLNAADFGGAYKEFGKWTKAAGKTLPGLVKRRAAEAALFAGDDWRKAL